MRNSGLIVQEIPEVQAPPAINGEVRARAFRESMGAANAADNVLPNLGEPHFYLVWLNGPLLEPRKVQLGRAGVSLLEALPTGAYKVRLEPGQAEQLRHLLFVTALRLYNAKSTGSDLITRSNARGLPLGVFQPMLTFDVRLHREDAADMQRVREWLKTSNIAIAGASSRKIRIYLLQGALELSEIAALPEVATLEESVPPKFHNDVARRLLRIDSGNPVTSLPLTGAGQIVAVADTGLDSSHPDFQGRILSVVALGRPNDSSDPAGHATPVAGSVLGDGSATARRRTARSAARRRALNCFSSRSWMQPAGRELASGPERPFRRGLPKWRAHSQHQLGRGDGLALYGQLGRG